MSGSEDRSGGDNSIQFIIIGMVGDKRLKNGKKRDGGVGDNRLTFLCYWLDKKMPLKKLHFGQFFLFVFVKFRNS